MLKTKNIDTFTLEIKDGYFYWKVKLKDNLVYQILYRIEKHVTPAGNKSKRKIYFIRKDDEELTCSEYDFKTKTINSLIKNQRILIDEINKLKEEK